MQEVDRYFGTGSKLLLTTLLESLCKRQRYSQVLQRSDPQELHNPLLQQILGDVTTINKIMAWKMENKFITILFMNITIDLLNLY